MQCWGLLGAMGSPAGVLARGLRRDAPAPGVAGADIVVLGVLRYEVVNAEAGALAPVAFAIAAASPSCALISSLCVNLHHSLLCDTSVVCSSLLPTLISTGIRRTTVGSSGPKSVHKFDA